MKRIICLGAIALSASLLVSCGNKQKSVVRDDALAVEDTTVVADSTEQVEDSEETVVEPEEIVPKEPVVAEGKNDCLLMGMNGKVKKVVYTEFVTFGLGSNLQVSLNKVGKVTSVILDGVNCTVSRGVDKGKKYLYCEAVDEDDIAQGVGFLYNPNKKQFDSMYASESIEGCVWEYAYVYDSNGEVTGLVYGFSDYWNPELWTNGKENWVETKYQLTNCTEDDCGNWISRTYKNDKGEVLNEKRRIEYYN